MNIFYNDLRSGYEEVAASGPSYWTEFKEMDAVYKFSGWTIDLMAHFLERLVQNQFVQYCDEKTLYMYEQILHLNATGLPIDERRRAIAAALLGYGKLSAEDIAAIVKAFTGSDCYVAWDGTELRLNLANSETGISYPSLIQILSNRIPAHIFFSLLSKYAVQADDYVGMAHRFTPRYNIQCEKLNYYYLRNRVGIGYVMNPKIIIQ